MTHQKILLAVDGSDRAFEAVRYLIDLEAFHDSKVTLFNVFSGIPQAYRDLGKDPQFAKSFREVSAWESQQKKAIEQYMKDAVNTLIQGGFSKDALKTKVQNKKEGVARDIISEAQKGYDCLVIGRKGVSKIREIALGSVANKLLEKIFFLPVMMVGFKKQPPGKILIAMDKSDGAMRGVDFVGKTLGNSDFKAHLVHVIRGRQEFQNFFLPQESSEVVRKEIKAVLDDARDRLIFAGFAPDNVTCQVITGVRSRAGAIIREAEAGGYETIVFGRRGLSRVQAFFIGRVGNKIIQMARRHTVWVIT